MKIHELLNELGNPGPRTFRGSRCTKDCSGHSAGFLWAAKKKIKHAKDCPNNPNRSSFLKGCQIASPVKENTLTEMPQLTTSNYDSYSFLLQALNDTIVFGNNIKKLPNNNFLLNLDDFYIIGKGDPTSPDILSQIEKTNDMIEIKLIAKKKGSNIYASDFYIELIDIFDTSFLLSDSIMSKSAVGIWKKLLSQTHKLYVVDTSNNIKQRIMTIEDLNNYISDNYTYKKYKFISEK